MNLTHEEARYWYRATYIRNFDGDTVDVLLDMGFFHDWQLRLRLYGINTPELRKETMEAGRAARDWLKSLLQGREFYVKTYRDEADKYGGRWLGEIYVPVTYITPHDPRTAVFDLKGELTNINQLMVRAGFAKPYFGTGEKS